MQMLKRLCCKQVAFRFSKSSTSIKYQENSLNNDLVSY